MIFGVNGKYSSTGQRHGDDRIGGMPAPEQIVFPVVQVLGIEHVDPRTDDLVPLDRRDVVAEEVDPVTADHGDALELTVRFERREFPDCRPGTGGIVHRGSRKLIQQRADSLGHFRPRSSASDIVACCRDAPLASVVQAEYS